MSVDIIGGMRNVMGGHIDIKKWIYNFYYANWLGKQYFNITLFNNCQAFLYRVLQFGMCIGTYYGLDNNPPVGHVCMCQVAGDCAGM